MRAFALMSVVAFLQLADVFGRAAILYQTGFEFSQGYSTNLDLTGQQGWKGQTAGGNGIVDGWFPGKGQQAYVGFLPPTNGDTGVFEYQPISKALAQAQFSALMAIENSSNTNWDDFYWGVYDPLGQELFSLDFDNYELKVYYHLGGATNRVLSGLKFTNDVVYKVNITMDFSANRWSAKLDNALIVTNAPITTNGATLKLGDVDAVWGIYDPLAPGDNFMLFDDYQVSGTVPSPQLTLLGILNGAPTLRVSSATESQFVLDASTNLVNWLPLKTNVASGGSFDFVDNTAVGLSRRFYRAHWLP